MVRLLTAYTLEADELEVALAEILEQLDLENNCLKNSAGFLFCHPDFISTGVAGGIAEALPFEIVGATTVCNFTHGLSGLTGLTISIMTSDICEFSAASLASCNTAEDVAEIYKTASEGRRERPSLIFPFAVSALSSGLAVEVLDKLTNGQTPLFGSNVVESTADISQSAALHNGMSICDGSVILVVWGELNARLIVSEINEGSLQEQIAVITESEGCIIKSINNACPTKYLESMGISGERDSGNLQLLPFIIDFRDGTKPVARGFYSITDEGYIITNGFVPENSTLAVGYLNSDEVIRVTDKTFENALACGKPAGMLIFPCVSHFWILEGSPFKVIQAKVDGVIPYQVFYSGGEICPIYGSNGKLYNRYHSFTCIACVFE